MGDGAVLVEVEDHTQAHALRRALLDAPLVGVRELIPGQCSLLIVVDPLILDLNTVAARLPAIARAPSAPEQLHEFSVVYDGEDLATVAKQVGMTEEEVVRRHTAPLYEVAFLGFVPGFPYLTGLDPGLRQPRRSRPRTRVPAGSVAVADGYTSIYPQATPGGWHIIGRCPVRLFDATRAEPALLMPGDRVRFTAAS
ncbi:MAG TPA: 5-oxoprolinase subunit PxpB [Gammaproteobacteria bacterium]